MKVRVKFFGILKVDTGEDTLEMDVSETGENVSGILKQIVVRFPQLKSRMDTLAYAVNHEFVDAKYELSNGDELALLPPVSGGSGKVSRITEEPLILDDLIAETEDHASGALIVFAGVVRKHNDG